MITETLDSIEPEDIRTNHAWVHIQSAHRQAEDLHDRVRDLLQLLKEHEVPQPVDLMRDIYNLLGEHRILCDTRYGPVWLTPSDAETYDEDDQLEEINRPEVEGPALKNVYD